jgi:hypothetical protein
VDPATGTGLRSAHEALYQLAVPDMLAGVAGDGAGDGADVPTAFVAVTVNVYAVPFERPTTAIGDAVPVATTDPGLEVTA